MLRLTLKVLPRFFADLSLTYDIPIGLEIATNENKSARYYTQLEKGTLAELLTQFVARYTQYTWKIEDGVVNVFPQDNYRDLLSKDLLAVKIERLSVKEKTSCWNFVALLLESPETKSILQANDTTYSRRSPSGFYIPQLGRNFSLNVSDLTVRSILNRVISESSTAKFWLITRDPDKTLLLDVIAEHEDSLKTKGKRPLQELFGERRNNDSP